MAACTESKLTLFMAEIFRTQKSERYKKEDKKSGNKAQNIMIMRWTKEEVGQMDLLIRHKKEQALRSYWLNMFNDSFFARARNIMKTSIKIFLITKRSKKRKKRWRSLALAFSSFLLIIYWYKKRWDTKEEVEEVKNKKERKQSGAENNLELAHQVSLCCLNDGMWWDGLRCRDYGFDIQALTNKSRTSIHWSCCTLNLFSFYNLQLCRSFKRSLLVKVDWHFIKISCWIIENCNCKCWRSIDSLKRVSWCERLSDKFVRV